MQQTILPQLRKNIYLKCNKKDLKSISMPKVPPHLKEMKLNLGLGPGLGAICHWTTFEPNVNLLEQWLYDPSQIIPVSLAVYLEVIISFEYHPYDDSLDPSLYVNRCLTEKIPEILDDECTIYDEGNDEFITGKRVIYNIKETIITEFYSPELIIETIEPTLKVADYYEMKMWQKIKIKYTPEQMDRVFNKHEMKLEDGTDVMERYKLNNEPFDALIVNTLSFSQGCGGFKFSW